MTHQWTIPVLAYHRIGEPKDDHVPTVSPETFERQLAFLQRRAWRVVEFGYLVDRLARGTPPERGTVIITFDDGYEETCSVAAPILHRFGFPAAVFVTPTDIGLPGFMTWDQLRAVAKNGIRVGSHTLYHTYLPLASREEAQRELVESKRLLEQQLGEPVSWLSYPVGGFTPELQLMAKAAGYQAACTTNRGVSKAGRDLFAIRRIKMTERDGSPLLLWVKLSGYYDLFRRLEQPA
ncbi:MAG: polysaccharide deacetylase family protein [Candidatus Omnitrophica bacterium]|nr:polysaccharide deacetylase family protein [Candidatus Omnitrophota bacterium]